MKNKISVAVIGGSGLYAMEGLRRVRELKEEQEQIRNEYEAANRVNDWNKAAELRYGRMSEIEKQLETANHELEAIKSGSALLKEEIDEEDIAA